MKPKDFPARKLRRQLVAKGIDLTLNENKRLLENDREERTKKDRGKQTYE